MIVMLEIYWIYFLIGMIAVALVAIIAFMVRKALKNPRMPVSPPPSLQAGAKLILPGNMEISLTESTRSIGRGDMTRVVSADDLGNISRRHFEAGFANGLYYIEDLDSLNGTKLNGVEIKGRGKHALKDGVLITVAEVITIIFRIS